MSVPHYPPWLEILPSPHPLPSSLSGALSDVVVGRTRPTPSPHTCLVPTCVPTHVSQEQWFSRSPEVDVHNSPGREIGELHLC